MIKSLDFHTFDLSSYPLTFKTIPDWVLIFIQTQFWKGLSLRRSSSKQSLPYPWYGGESDIVARIHHHHYYYYYQNYYVISLCFESLHKTQNYTPIQTFKRFESEQVRTLTAGDVRDYLNWIHDIQDKTPCIALTLFKHENGRVE